MTQEPWEPGLDTSSPVSPLRRFRAKLQEYLPLDREGDRGTYKVISFKFINLEVIEATSPWLFPIAEIVVSYSTSTDTRWDALAKSYRKLSPDAQNFKGLVGKMQEWAMLPAKRRNRDEQGVWGDVIEDMWQIVSVEGMGSTEEMDKAFNEHLDNLADGKDERGFHEAALGDPQVRLNTVVVTAITDRKLLDTLLAAGRLHRDAEGILHKGPKPA